MAIRRQFRKTTSAFNGASGRRIQIGPSQHNLDLVVHKLKEISRYSGTWEWIIVERCDGQSIRETVKNLYLEELRRGAWLTDIGLWKSLFDRTVVETVYDLARNGYICLLPQTQKLEKRLAA